MSIITGQEAKADHFIPTFTAGEAIAAGDAVALDLSDNKVYKASASAWGWRINFIGFAQGAATTNNPCVVNTTSVVTEKTGLTSGSDYFLSNTDGAIATSAGTISRKIGRAFATNRIYRPKNGTPVSPYISRSFPATTTPFTHLEVVLTGNGTGGNFEATINSVNLVSNGSSSPQSMILTLLPDDAAIVTAGTSASFARILDR